MKYIIPYFTPIYENLKDAKEFMKLRAAKKMKKEPAQISAEELELVLSQPKFVEIQQLLNNKLGYMLAFTRFHFEHGAKILGVPQQGWTLEKLLTTINQKRWILDELSHPIDWFAAQEEVNSVNPFEALTDEIDLLISNKEAKWIVNSLPAGPREEFRKLPKEKQQELFNAARALTELGKEVTGRLFDKVKAFKSWKVEDIIDYIKKYLLGYSNTQISKMVDQIEELQPQAGILHMDSTYLVLSMRTETAQKELCSIANWCINRGSFKQYVKNAIQINIFDFSKDPTDPMFLTGTTVNYAGRVTTSHDINDKRILSGESIGTHFSALGYPQALIASIEAGFDAEAAIKKIVYSLDLKNNKDPLKLFTKINQATNSFPELPSQGSIMTILNIIEEAISGKVKKEDLGKIYKNVGILNQLSAIIFSKFISLFDSGEVEEIIQTSYKNFERLELIQQRSPQILNATAKNILNQKELVIEQLKKIKY